MTLTVIATSARVASMPADRTCILRLAGTAEPDEQAPPDLLALADRAAERLRTSFPEWLWQWVQASGLLSLATYPGPISWWWYTPLSEMSPIRSPLLTQVYWLLLVRELLETRSFDRVIWVGDDRVMAKTIATMLARSGMPLEVRLAAGRAPMGFLYVLARRARFGAAHIARCLALRLAGFRSDAPASSDVVLTSRFPVLWEAGPQGHQERMFGDWPAVLRREGQSVCFAAMCSAPLGQIVRYRGAWRRRCRQDRIDLVEARASLATLLAAHFDVTFWIRYARWRRRQPAVVFDGIDISELFWREVTASAVSPELPSDRVLASAFGRLLDGAPRARLVAYPFEYQPMERAIGVAARSRGRATVGLQTGLFTANQLGFLFPASQVRADASDATRAPVPDLLAAYGDRPARAFAARLGERRVLRPGPIRYARLAEPPRRDRPALRREHGLPLDATVVLVTTSILKDESLQMLRAAFETAAGRSHTVLAFKFHYHLPLGQETERLRRVYPNVPVRVFDAHLDDLLIAADALICGASSTGIEAMARGCMPLVFRSVGNLQPSPILEVAEAAFFWRTPSELAEGLSATLANDASAVARRAHWPDALRAQLSPLAAGMNAPLNELLRGAGVLGPAVSDSGPTLLPETTG
jgi:hypothetical protein